MKLLTKKYLKSFSDYDDHLFVFKEEDKQSGLFAYVAIHNNNLGPATGGTRVFNYLSEKDAITDALRLSRAMTYKAALAGVGFGGGKGVIYLHKGEKKNKQMMQRYAKFINDINDTYCEYTTGEDVGLDQEDVELMTETSKFIVGSKGKAGDPSPFAALSCYYAIKESVNFLLKKKNLKGTKVAVKGVGKVGSVLVDFLVEEGCAVYISDINRNAIDDVKRKYPNVISVENYEISKLDVDIYSPCAMGGEFTNVNVNNLNCKIICGAANNQLVSPNVGNSLKEIGIWYIPDYVTNCGGLINVIDQLESSGYKKERVTKRIIKVKKTVAEILRKSLVENIPTNLIADSMAQEKIFAKHGK
ncbi:MAG: Glu/Leu/Phe/Val dehydrogenase dimerization region [Candidatus Woesebacteria bacterium GW2011_GWA1_37_8]|uniref:Glu/Leu/Phe/Val dehydrogenase dimerization region n=2 Tax=Candidatus Woeseibacteriota TaxID=1752722 RepID=A0A0G0NMY7_9BACT|nr:MAG: Glu/Leu/Phe/Val dehydrogenase dimerization region [Microgenomates group bacterium GW2011_GWC1_37_12b]KKQ45942.1 MAG: Glu/Leu/Phe/Val dehydrogenase dimerization region [Candidatus Woesebacteria bacterium GW2011_GWA1_37_8]KKQ87254.1 MAG: Glu/Leu/Phe/Val dehydrogenase dimerization region [Candidatus Woesebacteria bacterium GW2011_GWB1_38_8b]